MRKLLVPAAQRRTLEELTAELDLRSGDRPSNYSAYWTMLVLSAVIAATGVISDSTATAIGAMIIAPLSIPIMGLALPLVKRTRTGAGWFVLGGAAAVVALEPPRRHLHLRRPRLPGRKAEPTRIPTALALSAVGLVVIVPLGVSTAAKYLFAAWRSQVKDAATAWLAATPGATVTSVQTRSRTLHISVRTPNGLPPVPDLLSRLHGVIPDGSPVLIDTTQGRTINAGTVKP